MNYLKLSSIYRKFSDKEKSFIKEKIIEADYTVKQWMILLQKVAAYDEANDKTRKKMVTWLVITGIAAFFSLFFAPLLAGIFAVIFVVLVLIRRQLATNDLSNHLRLFLIPLLKVLHEKAGPKASLLLKLDFRPHGKQEMKNKYKQGNRTIRQFNPEWLKGAVVLRDGTKMDLQLADDLKKLTVRKTSASGKTKIKNKVKSTHFLLIRLTLKKDFYTLKNDQNEEVIASEVEDKIVLKTKVKQKVTIAEDVLAIKQFLEVLDKLYAAVDPVPGKLDDIIEQEPEQRPERREEEEEVSEGALGFAGPAFFMWSMYDFDDYDYDNFDYESTPVFSEELDRDSIFDS